MCIYSIYSWVCYSWFTVCGCVGVWQIQVWDTAGQERFRTITQSYYRSAHGAMIAYDITRRPTFDSVKHWIKEVELHGATNVVLVLIGEPDVNIWEYSESWSFMLWEIHALCRSVKERGTIPGSANKQFNRLPPRLHKISRK